MTTLELVLTIVVIWLWASGATISYWMVIKHTEKMPRISEKISIFISWPFAAIVSIIMVDRKLKTQQRRGEDG